MPRRGENIRKRKDGRWEGRYRPKQSAPGKYRSVYGATYSEVKQKLRSVHLFEPKESRRTFADAAESWLQSNAVRLKGASENKYRYMIERHLLPAWKDRLIESISAEEINLFLNEKLCRGRLDGSGGLSPAYVRTLSILLRSILNFSSAAPFHGEIIKPKLQKQELQILSPPSLLKLEKYLLAEPDLIRFGTYLALQTGLRVGELCALSWEDVDLENRILHIRHTVSRVPAEKGRTKLILDRPKTESSAREIPLPRVLLPLLKEQKAKARSPFVVSDREGFLSTRTFDARYRRMLKDACIEPIRFHSLRHTFATRCVNVGMDIKSLSEILGHSGVAITLDTYVHSSMERKRAQIEKLFA